MKKYFFPAIKLTFLSLVLLAGVYTLVLLGLAQIVPGKGLGKKIESNNHSYYSNIGERFTQDKYFWSRPSAVDYNGAGSGGSNLGPNNPELLNAVQARIDTFLLHNPGIAPSAIPVDLVTASGSGLDPDISVKAAMVQVKRIAHIRNIPEEKLQELVKSNTQKPFLDMFGPEKINVLQLNIALDKL